MRLTTLPALMASLAALVYAAPVPFDSSRVRPGAITLQSSPESAAITWPGGGGKQWTAVFSLDPAKPLVTSIGTGGRNIIERAQPQYWITTGKRRGGFDQFFDLPPSHPEGIRRFTGSLQIKSARAETIGDRLEITFDGLSLGVFQGSIRYVFYPGSRLIQQQAVLVTSEPDVAYFYDAGLKMAVDADRRAGGNMETTISYFDTRGQLQTAPSGGPERIPVAVRYRAIAAATGAGSVAVFPPPHQYFFARDYTTNMGYVWHSAWRGNVALGIRQLPDDYTPYYPWMGAPPGTSQEMSLFLLVDDGPPAAVLEKVTRYTHRDRLPKLDGYKTVAPHWHLAYTVQAMEKGFDWLPPFKPAMKEVGIDSAILMDFHGDGHPFDTTETRLKELQAYFRACQSQSDKDFLLIPAEEMNQYLGGHWGILFPKPVYWFMKRAPGEPFQSTDPKYGTVYRVGDDKDMLALVRAESGLMYQTHPRTKGSTGFPDKIRDSEQFRDPRYLGAGWKAMPSDLSSPRLGERAFKTIDDANNWGLRKRMIGEVDVFQLDTTHELYAHMNINYVRIPELPAFARYGEVLAAMAKGDYFITTGEILLPEVAITPGAGDRLLVKAKVNYTFPLRMAEIVWGDGSETHRKMFPLSATREFGNEQFTWDAGAKGWKWARVAVWDVAGNGAFVNPVWR